MGVDMSGHKLGEKDGRVMVRQEDEVLNLSP